MDKLKTPTQADKPLSTEYFNGKIPYGFISKREIDWIKSERSLIGEGTYGKVYRYETPHGLVVVKLITHNNQVKENYIKEITFLRTINHPNVIRLLDVFFTRDEIGIVLPLRSTTLDRVLGDKHLKVTKSKKIDITPIIVDSIIYQIIQGMIAIQDNNILNGDYKLDNILVYPSENGECIRIQISDFGLANVDECFEKPFEWELFIPPYRPPELGLYREHTEEGYDTRPEFPLYTRKGDSWVLGCIIYHILTGKYLFEPKDNEGKDTSFYREVVGMKVDDIVEEDGMTQLLKKWIDYDDIDETEDSERDMKLLNNIEDTVPEKYAIIIYNLLKFYPQERMDIREVANYPGLFDEVLANKNLCITRPQKSIGTKREEDIIAYCLAFLNAVQFSIGNKKIQTLTPRNRVVIMDGCEQLVSTFGFEVDLSGRVKALTVVLLDTYSERNASEGGEGVITFSHLAGAFLVAVAFYGEVVVETEEILNLIDNVSVSNIFSCALQVFASVDFKLVKSTSYDLIRIDRSEHKLEVVDTAYWLLQISYMTNIYKIYSHEQICFGIYLISELLNNRRVNIVPKDREVAAYLLKDVKNISKYIDNDILNGTRRGGVNTEEMWNNLLSLEL